MIIDTSALIEIIRKGEFIEGSVSVITLLEILRGVAESKREEVKEKIEEIFDIVYLSNEIILEYCKLYDTLRSTGKILPDADLLIAATAIAMKDTLISNDSDFKWFEKLGLKLKNFEG